VRQKDFASWVFIFTQSTTKYKIFFSYFIDQSPKMLNLLFCQYFFQFSLKRKKYFFWAFLDVGQQNKKQMCVHCCTLCKITAPMDNNCGNESKSCLTHKVWHFTPTFLTPDFGPKNTIKWASFWTHSFHFCQPISFNNWWIQEKNHSHPILQTNEVIPNAQSGIDKRKVPCTLQ
jgi:hypothetical protein